MYGTLIIAYLFLGGAAGGSFLVMSLWSLAFHRRHPHRSDELRGAFRSLKSIVYPLSTIVLAVALSCLLWDLEHPSRMMLIFLLPHPTVLTFGAASLALLLLVGLLLSLANLFHVRILGGRIKAALELLCAPIAALAMGYTGVFLYSNLGVPLWHTFTLIGLFFFSALSSGLSVIMLVDYLAQSQTRSLNALRPLQRWHLACLLLEGAFLVAFCLSAWLNPNAAPAIEALLAPNVLSTALVGAVGFGIVIPFLLESYTLLRKEQRAIPVSDFLCLIGAFCLRWSVIVCGVH